MIIKPKPKHNPKKKQKKIHNNQPVATKEKQMMENIFDSRDEINVNR